MALVVPGEAGGEPCGDAAGGAVVEAAAEVGHENRPPDRGLVGHRDTADDDDLAAVGAAEDDRATIILTRVLLMRLLMLLQLWLLLRIMLLSILLLLVVLPLGVQLLLLLLLLLEAGNVALLRIESGRCGTGRAGALLGLTRRHLLVLVPGLGTLSRVLRSVRGGRVAAAVAGAVGLWIALMGRVAGHRGGTIMVARRRCGRFADAMERLQ